MARARNGNGGVPIQVWAGIGIPSITVIGTFVGLIYWLAGVALKVTAQDAMLATQMVRIDADSSRLNKLEIETASQKTSLNEIETQFCANDIVRNLMHASDMRTMAMLWQRVSPNEKLPTDNAYYPTVCNRATHK